MQKRGFSIDLGPDLDPPGTDEWGWLEDEEPESSIPPEVRIRRDRSHYKRDKIVERRRARPKPIPPREVPSVPVEILMEPETKPDEMTEFARDVSLDAIQQIAEASHGSQR